MAETIWALLEAAAADHAGRPWLHFEEEIYSFGAARQEAGRRGRALAAAGVEPGDRVVVALPNSPELLFTWFGLMGAGGVLVAVNPDGGADELRAVLGAARPRLVLTDGARHVAMGELAAATCPHAQVIEAAALADRGSGRGRWDPPTPPAADDLAVFIATSGTTGQPKLVMHCHRTFVLAAEGFPWWMGLTPEDRLMTSLPLFHLNAQVYSTLGSLAAGAGLVLLPRFSASAFWNEARRHGATEFNAIGAMVEILMRQPVRSGDADNPVRLCYLGPAPPRQRHLEIEERFGLRLHIGYALSESPFGTIWPLEEPRPFESMGRPRQHPKLGHINEARIVDADGNEVTVGETGELLLRNPATMAGYFGDPEGTEEALRGGWLHTGDLVRADAEGWIYFVARKKDLIRRRGENIAPAEVEAVIDAHPAVAECAVVGVPSALTEEDVKAFIKLRAGQEAAAQELARWCTQRLAAFKVPRYVEFVDELPYTPTGRVAKQRLPRSRTPAEHDLRGG